MSHTSIKNNIESILKLQLLNLKGVLNEDMDPGYQAKQRSSIRHIDLAVLILNKIKAVFSIMIVVKKLPLEIGKNTIKILELNRETSEHAFNAK